MNIDIFTQKSREAIQQAEKLTYDYGNPEIRQSHILLALLEQEDGLIPKLIQKMDIDLNYFRNDITQMVQNLPKVSGNVQVQVSNDANQVLIHGEDEAKAMGDSYVSVEHLFLAMQKYPDREIKQKF